MRFQPAFLEVERRIADGQIGQPQLVQADLGFPADSDPSGRLFTARLGGGSLLDVGVYPLTLAMSFVGAPTSASAVARLNDDGVDTQVSAAMHHDHGTSTWSCSLETDSGMEATVGGTLGSLRFEAPFHHSARITRRERGEVAEEFVVPEAEQMYRLEVREVHDCLDRGARESSRMPLDLTLSVMGVMDELRGQIGVHYPGESPRP